MYKLKKMRTLNVSISENEYKLYGIQNDKVTFADFVAIIRREIAVENLDKCVEMAGKYGLSKMSLDEINEEITAVRNDAKTGH